MRFCLPPQVSTHNPGAASRRCACWLPSWHRRMTCSMRRRSKCMLDTMLRADPFAPAWPDWHQRVPKRRGVPKLQEKLCTGCDRTLPRSAYHERVGAELGWINWQCKECDRTRQMGRYWRRIRLLDAIRLAIGCADCGYSVAAHVLD